MVKRILITVDDDLYSIIQKTKGFGNKDAEKVVNIVRSWYSEKSVISSSLKRDLKLE